MYPTAASTTPGTLRNSTSTCQKQPAPNVAFSVIKPPLRSRLRRTFGHPVTRAAPGRYVLPVSQRPLELILARNLLSSLSTPAFLVDEAGVLVFYNDAAGVLLGRRFEEAGR